MPKKGKNLREGLQKISKAVDFPAEVFSNHSQILLFGDRLATVDGCYGLVEYSNEQVCLNLGCRLVRFSGRKLEIGDYNGEALNIKGKIQAVEYAELEN